MIASVKYIYMKMYIRAGQFYGFHGSRSSQFQTNDLGVGKLVIHISFGEEACYYVRFLSCCSIELICVNLSVQATIPNGSHLASTYCALAILKTVGYDLSLIDAELLLQSMKNLQQPDGWYYMLLSFY